MSQAGNPDFRSEADFLVRRAGGHDAMLRRLWQGHVRCVFITDGGSPIRWFTREASGEVPAFRIDAIDTTAAGDAFVGALLTRLVERDITAGTLPAWLSDEAAIIDTVRHAAAGGALAATRHGAFAAMPTRDEIHTLLSTQA